MTAPQDPYSYPGEPGRRAGFRDQLFSNLAILCGVMAALLYPFFGVIGAVLAAVGRQRGEPRWKLGLAFALGGFVLGLIITRAVLSLTD